MGGHWNSEGMDPTLTDAVSADFRPSATADIKDLVAFVNISSASTPNIQQYIYLFDSSKIFDLVSFMHNMVTDENCIPLYCYFMD